MAANDYGVTQYIGARYVPKFYENSEGGNDWTPNTIYEPLTIVTRNGNSYTSKIPVPATVGAPENNTTYWIATGNYNEQIETLRQLAVQANQGVETLKGKTVDPDNFEGTDIQKLQAAVDYAVAHYYPIITISRVYDLTGGTININKGAYISNDEFLRYRGKLTFAGSGSGGFIKNDTGYFFSAVTRSGDIAFMNLTFRGSVVLDDGDDVQHRKNGNSIFDTSKLFRITTFNNSYTLVGCVFDGRRAQVRREENAQSNYSFGDLLTYSDCFYHIRYLWDCAVNGCIIENCNCGFRSDANNTIDYNDINALKIDNCTIESCPEHAIDFNTGDNPETVVIGLSVTGCYFEANGSIHLDIDTEQRGTVIERNRFAMTNAGEIGVKIEASVPGTEVSRNNVTGAAGRLCNITQKHSYVVPVWMYDNMIGSSSASNDQLYGIQPHFSGLFNKLYFPLESATNCDNIGNSWRDGMLRITATDTFGGLPTGENNGELFWHTDGGNALQFFATATKIYARVRLSGVGWTAWREI